MAKPTLIVPDSHVAQGAILLAHYAEVPVQTDITMAPSGSVALAWDGQRVEGVTAVYCQIARMSKKADALLGSTDAVRAEVQQMLSYRNTVLDPLLDDALLAVNDILLPRTWLCGSGPTVADFALYATVLPAVKGLTAPQKVAVPCVLRWFDLCQHRLNATRVFETINVGVPALSLPSPAELAAMAGAAAKRAPSGKEAAASANSATDANGKASASAASGKGGAANGKGGAAEGKSGAAAAEGKGAKADGKGAPKGEDANGGGKWGKGEGAGDKGKKGKAADGATTAKGPSDAKSASAAKAPASDAKSGASSGPSVSQLDIRVGTIVECKPHPDADALYVEQIDFGPDLGTRQVISGLRKFVPLEQMQGRRVCAVVNLKAAKMRGVDSHGLVLCASDASHERVDPVAPPPGAANGDRVTFAGFEGEPDKEINESKKKVFGTVSDEFVTDATGAPTYRGVPFMTPKGAVTSSIPNGNVK